jgi:hypothetical protein
MDIEQTIAEIEWLELLLTLPDNRLFQMADWKSANQRHIEAYANDPWFRLPRQQWLEDLFRLPDNRPFQAAD